MTCTSKLLPAVVLTLASALALAGCAESKKTDVAPNATDGTVVEEEVIEVEETEMPAEEPAEPAAEPAEEPSDEPPAPEKPVEEEKKDETAAAESDSEPADGKVMLGSDELLAGIPGEGKLKVEEIEAWLADDKNHEVLDFVLPMGLAKGASGIKGVDKNPLTRAKIELGRQLYFDPRLSADDERSVAPAATIRTKDLPGTRSLAWASRVRKAAATRRSATTAFLSDKQFWDGRADFAGRAGRRADRQPDRNGQHARRVCRMPEGHPRIQDAVRQDLRPHGHRSRGRGAGFVRARRRHRPCAVRLPRGSSSRSKPWTRKISRPTKS